METFESPIDKHSYTEYDAAGNARDDANFDPEAQGISDDFKRPPY